MKRGFWAAFCVATVATTASGQDYAPMFENHGFIGAGSVGSGEPLFRYDDQERWKHGYLQIMPFYGGHFAFRPYNYHHVFSQSQTAAGWGMPATMPYSQQFWHRYEKMADLSRGDHSPVVPVEPPPQMFDHYPKPIHGPSRQYQQPLPPSPDSASLPYPSPGFQQAAGPVPYYGQYQPVQYQPQAPAYQAQQPVMQMSSGDSSAPYQQPAYAVPAGPELRPQVYDQGQMQRYFQQGR